LIGLRKNAPLAVLLIPSSNTGQTVIKLRISITIKHNVGYSVAITATSCVLTANDWQYAKDIKPGDWVFNHLGQPVRVKTTQIYRSEECYRVEFDDYLAVEGDANVTLPIEDAQYRKRAMIYKGRMVRTAALKMFNVRDLDESGLTFRGNRKKYSVPTTEPIQLPHQPLGIPPFVYGFWFCSRLSKKILRVPYEFADETFQYFKDSGYQIEKLGDYQGKYEKFRTVPSIWDQLKGQQTRKIPVAYLNGSPEQRLDLIKGILATRLCKNTNRIGSFTIKTRKKNLHIAIQFLSESLGAKAEPKHDKITGTYDLRITRLKPFLEKMGKHRPVVHLARRYVNSIKPIPAQLCVHIETDEKNGTFLVGEGFIPCH